MTDRLCKTWVTLLKLSTSSCSEISRSVTHHDNGTKNSFKKVNAVRSHRMCFLLHLEPNTGEPLACWWFIHASVTRLCGPFQIQLFPNYKLDLFFDLDAAERRGGHFRAFGILIDFHTSLVIKSCVRFLTLTGVLLKSLPWPG